MSRRSSQQISLKPQDVVVLVKLCLAQGQRFTYASLASELAMSASEIHGSLGRAKFARLAVVSGEQGVQPIRSALREFLIYGVRYAFPATSGSITRGIPTGYAGPVLRNLLTQSDEPPPVWPLASGDVRGVSIHPLYPTVPAIAQRDLGFYELFSLVDAIRIGAARERELAANEISKRLN
jgi:hypothetical protein